MKFMINQPVEVEVDAIRCVLPVRYEEEDIPNDFPLRRGDVWEITFDVQTGIIRGWPQGRQDNVQMKVVDGGSYYLMSGEKVIAELEQDYVPSCIPGDSGDYVNFDIDEFGKITNWEFDAKDIAASFGLE